MDCRHDMKKKEAAELRALIHHMGHHSEHHAEDIDSMCKKAEKLGYEETAERLKKCKELNAELVTALETAEKCMEGI